MDATGEKRRLTSKVASMKARKRRKLDGGPVSSYGNKARVRKTGLTADDLAWNDVSIDHLTEFEGVYGFEEVEDVEVVEDPATGRKTFAAATTIKPDSIDKASKDEGLVDDAIGDELDDEWSGFGDDDEPEHVETNSKHQDSTPTQKSKATKSPKTSSAVQNGPRTTDTSGLFQSLELEAEEADIDVSAWKALDLSPDTLASLSRLKFSTPTAIQRSGIPEILSGHDVIGKASTGSGKTLAFGIPILELFLELRTNNTGSSTEKSPLALILSPTRELAHQLDKHLTALCSNGLFEGPSIATLTGGLSLQKQQRILKRADIVIGTPGRLWEVLSDGKGVMKALKGIKFLVVDEADRLLSEGHFKEVEEILNALDREEEDDDEAKDEKRASKSTGESIERQTLVFSATFDRGLQRKLAGKGRPGGDLMDNKQSLEWLLSKLNFREEKPKFIDVNPVNQLATGLKEGLIECAGTEKDLYLYTLLLLHPNTRTLVFANSINAVRRLTPFLQNLNMPAMGLHSGMPQKARLRAVERFKEPSNAKTACPILVASDVAARGLDIPGVQLVIHYHLPRAADMYVHRSGRTARAGQPGSSILICAPEEVAGVRRLVAKVHAASAVAGAEGGGRQGGYYIRTLDIDRRIVTRLKQRATLAKKIADATIAKEKLHKEDDFTRAAAEELGVDYDSESFEAEAAKGKRGRGSGRKRKEKEAASLSKGELGAVKAELKGLLKQRVNVGVSERYLTSGSVDIDELLRRQGASSNGTEFLGSVQGVGLLDD